MNFKKYEKELNKAGYFISADQVTNTRGDVVGQMDPYGEFHYSDETVAFVICEAVQAEMIALAKLAKPKKRARTVRVLMSFTPSHLTSMLRSHC